MTLPNPSLHVAHRPAQAQLERMSNSALSPSESRRSDRVDALAGFAAQVADGVAQVLLARGALPATTLPVTVFAANFPPVEAEGVGAREDAAATKLQAARRGCLERRKATQMRQHMSNSDGQRDREAAAARMQALHRGRAGRREVEQIKALRREQANAAAKMQALQRGKLGRQEAKQIKELRRQQAQAAARMQAVQRGRVGRREAQQIKSLRREQANAAAKIQTLQRRRLQRQEAAEVEMAKLQQQQAKAAVKIQALQRQQAARQRTARRQEKVQSARLQAAKYQQLQLELEASVKPRFQSAVCILRLHAKAGRSATPGSAPFRWKAVSPV